MWGLKRRVIPVFIGATGFLFHYTHNINPGKAPSILHTDNCRSKDSSCYAKTAVIMSM